MLMSMNKRISELTLNQVLLGAVGGTVGPSIYDPCFSNHKLLMIKQKYGTGRVRPEQGLLTLRKSLNTFGNLRPCSFAAPSLIKGSPLKESVCAGVDFTVVRELTGGIYFGPRKEADEQSPDIAFDTEVYSKAEIERITRLAGFMAMKHSPPLKTTSLDKANVLATSRLWRKTVTEVLAREFAEVRCDHQLIDSACMTAVKSQRS